MESLASRTSATLIPKPVLLGAIFKANQVPAAGSFADTLSPVKKSNAGADMLRMLKFHNVPYNWPSKYPTRSVNALRVLLAAGSPWSLIHAIYRAYWVEGKDITEDEVLLGILQATAIPNPEQVLEKSKSDGIKQQLEQTTNSALEGGAYGVPTFFVKKCSTDTQLMFYGLDRMYQIETYLGTVPLSPALAVDFKGNLFPVDFYFDFSSPFTYIAATRVNRYFGQQNVKWIPMLLGALFKKVGMANTPMTTMSPRKVKYNQIDMNRQAQAAGAPLVFSSHFPLRTVLALRVTLAVGPNTEKGQALIQRIFQAAWVQNLDVSSPEVITKICASLGLDGQKLIAEANSDPIKQKLNETTEQAAKAGCYGAPSLVVHLPTGPQLFWGNDRLEYAVYAARDIHSLPVAKL